MLVCERNAEKLTDDLYCERMSEIGHNIKCVAFGGSGEELVDDVGCSWLDDRHLSRRERPDDKPTETAVVRRVDEHQKLVHGLRVVIVWVGRGQTAVAFVAADVGVAKERLCCLVGRDDPQPAIDLEHGVMTLELIEEWVGVCPDCWVKEGAEQLLGGDAGNVDGSRHGVLFEAGSRSDTELYANA